MIMNSAGSLLLQVYDRIADGIADRFDAQAQERTLVKSDDIYEAARGCQAAFEEYLHSPRAYREEIIVLQRRFTSWAGFLGVFAAPTLCLDTRLAARPEVKDLFVSMLTVLENNLKIGTSNVVSSEFKSLTKFLGKARHPMTTDVLGSDDAALVGILGSVDRLGRLALLVRAPSKPDEMQRVLNSRLKREPDGFEKVILTLINYKFSSEKGCSMPESLQRQLASSVAYRRDRLIYELRHDKKLGADRNESNVSESAPTVMGKLPEMSPPTLPKVNKNKGRVSQIREQQAHTSYSQAKSLLRPQTGSVASSLSSYSPNPFITAEYPNPPMIPSDRLEADCTYCRKGVAREVLGDKKKWMQV